MVVGVQAALDVSVHILNVIGNLKDLAVIKNIKRLAITQHDILRERAVAVVRLFLIVVSLWHGCGIG